MLSNDLGHPAKLVECGNDEVDANVVIMAGCNFPHELTFRGVVKHNRRSVDIFSDVIEPPAAYDLPVAENA